MPADLQRLKEIFLAAVDRADPDEREAYLRQACGGDAELRRQVEALLREHERPGSFLGPPSAGPASTADPRPGESQGGSPAEGPGSGWSCSSRCARRCSTPTRRGSSTAT